MTVVNQYADGFYDWCSQQMGLLQDKKFDELDCDGLIKNIKDIQYSVLRCAYRRFENILTIYLMNAYAPEKITPEEQGDQKDNLFDARYIIKDIFEKNPTLTNQEEHHFIYVAYQTAKGNFRINTAEEDDDEYDDRIPIECPYTIEQCLDEEFYPGGKEHLK